MAGKYPSALHEYERPPVIETILSVHFRPVRNLTTAHLGLFWERLDRRLWPKLRELGSIVPQIERFDVSPSAPLRFRLKEMERPEVRLRLSNEAESKVVQVQSNLIQTHWIRGSATDTDYPRYWRTTKPEFLAIWESFVAFLGAEGFGKPHPLQWEATYINRIPSGEGELWQTPADWPSLFNGVLVSPLMPDGSIESASVKYHYRLADDKGRLHVELRHVMGGDADAESLDMTWTARGQVLSNSVEEGSADLPTINRMISTGLDIGRCAIVNGFTASGSQKSLQFWGHKTEVADA